MLIGFANNKIDNLDPYLHEDEKHLAKIDSGDGKWVTGWWSAHWEFEEVRCCLETLQLEFVHVGMIYKMNNN